MDNEQFEIGNWEWLQTTECENTLDKGYRSWRKKVLMDFLRREGVFFKPLKASQRRYVKKVLKYIFESEKPTLKEFMDTNSSNYRKFRSIFPIGWRKLMWLFNLTQEYGQDIKIISPNKTVS